MPQSLYVDRDSIYRCEGLGSIAEQIAGKEPQTQFGRAMEQLGVELILANSPQAKGRVERMNGVLQDRLVKALRLAGINDMAKANEYLRQTYLPEHNRKFQKEPASAADVHRGVPRRLHEVLSWEVERVVQRDWTVRSEGKRYQLDRRHEALSLAGRKVIVRCLRDGTVQLEHQGVKLKWRAVAAVAKPAPAAAPAKRAAEKRETTPATTHGGNGKPGADHPWRRQRIGSVRGDLARRREEPLVVGDSGRPPLRSGLPASPTTRGREHKQPRGHFHLSS